MRECSQSATVRGVGLGASCAGQLCLPISESRGHSLFAGANNLHLSVPIGSDGDRTAAFVAGPAAFPVGKATVYVVHALMADPTLITGKKQR